MKKLLSVQQLPVNMDFAILLARVAIAVLMLTHGLPKLSMFFADGPIQFPPVMGMSPELSLGMAVFAEVFCSVLILVGFSTRLAVIPLAITMLTAVLVIHAADPLSVKESALHYLLVYAVLFLTGSGRYSVDALVQRAPAKVALRESRS
jgi:putative oxidoreductase